MILKSSLFASVAAMGLFTCLGAPLAAVRAEQGDNDGRTRRRQLEGDRPRERDRLRESKGPLHGDTTRSVDRLLPPLAEADPVLNVAAHERHA